MRTLLIILAAAGAIAIGAPAAAQQTPSPAQSATWAAKLVQMTGDVVVLKGIAEVIQGDTRVFADEAEYYQTEERVVARGNVVVSQGDNTISADRAEFTLKTRTGTFYNASGSANIRPRPQLGGGGGFAPPASTEPTDVYFFGEVVEKIGSRTYRITKGGFSTCVQPTPRWNLTAGTVHLTLDDYTLLRNAVFKVKGVPLLYLPILYYPTKEEERSTGFLLPTYSSSTLRGQSISNQFFWAINRSHDARFYHDWFSKTGQGYGGEYRYNLGVGDGNIRAYLLDQTAASFAVPGGAATAPDSRVLEIRGGAAHSLPFNLRARGSADYSTDIITMQTFYTNVYDARRNRRGFGGNLVGSWGALSMNAVFDRSENFYDSTNSMLYGNSPRVSINRSERPLFSGAPIYFSVNGEYAGIEREGRVNGDPVSDSGLIRLDLAPTVSLPFKRWQWFTVNSTLSWRDTFYSRSYAGEDAPVPNLIIDDAVNRRYYTLAARVVGPVFNRVWDTPGSDYAQRFKHTVEPFLNVSRTSSIDNYSRIVQTDGIDYVIGNAASYNYGVNNRFYAKRAAAGGGPGQPVEIMNVALSQSYYTDERQAEFDRQNTTNSPPSHFSPIRLDLNAAPSSIVNGNLRAEIDHRYLELRTMSAAASYNPSPLTGINVSWSRRFLIEELPEFNNPDFVTHAVNLTTSARTRNNGFGGTYFLQYDLVRDYFVTQSIQAFYHAQCCGISMQYLHSGFVSGSIVPSNRTFFLSFTLAGLGNFSPFNGAMGAIPR